MTFEMWFLIPWAICGACYLIYRLASANQVIDEAKQYAQFCAAMNKETS